MGSAWHIRASQFACLTAVILACLPPGIVTVHGFQLEPRVAQGNVDAEGVEVHKRGVSSDWLLSVSSKEDHLIIVLVVIRGPGGQGFFMVHGWVDEGEGESW
jgi:hypothetical protein